MTIASVFRYLWKEGVRVGAFKQIYTENFGEFISDEVLDQEVVVHDSQLSLFDNDQKQIEISKEPFLILIN